MPPNTRRRGDASSSSRESRGMRSSSACGTTGSAFLPSCSHGCLTFLPRGTAPSPARKGGSGSGSRSSGRSPSCTAAPSPRRAVGPAREASSSSGSPAAQGLAPAAAVPAGGPADSPVRRLRVLVVEDRVDTAKGMAELLKLSGDDAWIAHSGEEALIAARVHRPEVMLLDIGLPGMDGYELASRLRQEECGRDTVLIALTGYGDEQALQRSKEAGINHHLVKPVDFDALLALINRLH